MVSQNTLLLLAAVLLSPSVLARTDCPAAPVLNIQIESNVILYLQKNAPWRRLGTLDEIGTRERLTALLAAQMSGRKVMVAYQNDGYDCTATNYAESAFIVRTYNE